MDYLAFFNLSEDPFGLTPDSHYFYPSKMHNDVLASLDYAVEQKEGFSLIIGEPGTGKTTILKIFIDRWKERAEIALIMTPRLSPEELLQAILDDLNIHIETTNKNEMIKVFRDFLINHSLAGRRVIIIVDEAQSLSDGCLEELRLLSNLETEKEKLLQIILVGQPELQRRLHSEGLRQLDQRISIRANLKPLTATETSDYISFRLIKAGKGSAIFDDKAKKLIHKLSGGVPRLINLTASRAMMIAYIGASHHIRNRHVRDTVKHIPDTRPKMGFRTATLKYAAIVIILILSVSVLVVGYNILQRNSTSLTTVTKSAGPYHTRKAATSSSNLPASINAGNITSGQKIATVSVRAARLREWPSVEAGIASLVSKGESFEVTGEWTASGGSKWYKVRIPKGGEYWISSYIVRVSSSLHKPH
jgi:general secretion pathway protein A